MTKITEELTNDIKESKSIDLFIESNLQEFDSKLFVKTLQSFLQVMNISKQELIRRSCLNASFVYDIFNSKKTPSRDTVIKLSLALGLTLQESNRLLQLAGYSNLYPRIEREAIIIFCIHNRKGLGYTNDLLDEMQEELLFQAL